jgi:F-type H+-transporting ATPase subunit a
LTSAWTPLLAAGDDPMSHVLPHPLFEVGGYGVTNHLVMLVVAAVLLMLVLPIAAAAKGVVPTGFRNFVESILQFLREDVVRPILGEATDRYIPILWTLFFLILTANVLGMIPLGAMAAPLDAHLQHIGGTATGNLSITAGLAVCAFLFIHIAGIKEQGFVHYAKNFVPHVHWSLLILFIPLEIWGALVKPFVLAVRLFANMLAGHIVLAVIIGFGAMGLALGGAFYGVTLAAALGAVALSLLELFVALLQAYVFTFLTTLFVGMAVHPEH